MPPYEMDNRAADTSQDFRRSQQNQFSHARPVPTSITLYHHRYVDIGVPFATDSFNFGLCRGIRAKGTGRSHCVSSTCFTTSLASLMVTTGCLLGRPQRYSCATMTLPSQSGAVPRPHRYVHINHSRTEEREPNRLSREALR